MQNLCVTFKRNFKYNKAVTYAIAVDSMEKDTREGCQHSTNGINEFIMRLIAVIFCKHPIGIHNRLPTQDK